jgi:hypothetical protein
MKWIVLGAAVLAAALLWSGWWWFGSSAQVAAIENWLAERRQEGWQAEAAAVEAGGFPNRFDLRLIEPRLADPDAGWAWSAPFLDILMLSYRPDRAVLAFPPEQSLAAPGARATLRSEGMRASLRLTPLPSLPLERMSLEAHAAALAGEGWTASARALAAHVAESGAPQAAENAYDVYLGLADFRPPEGVAEALRLPEGLPAALERLVLDGRATFRRPLDRRSLEERPPELAALSVKSAEAVWGRLSLAAEGRLVADAEGFAEGELQVRATGWREMLDAAVAAGAIGSNAAGLARTALGFMAAFGADRDAIEAPVSFSGGRTWIGPAAIAPAPRLAPPER